MGRRKSLGAWFAPLLTRLSKLQTTAFSIATLYFVGQSIICIQLILRYYGSLEDQWRVISASAALFISLLFVASPFVVVFYIRRELAKKEKAN
jgi:hypothetical protein